MSSTGVKKRKLRSTDIHFDIKLVRTIAFGLYGSKLPSKRQVLQVMFYHIRFHNKSARESARAVVRELFIFWDKAGIPTPKESRCIEKLEKLYNEWKDLQKIVTHQHAKQKNDEKKFTNELDNLFDIAHTDALQMIKIEEDKEFLLLQRQKERPGCMIGIDTILVAKEKRKSDRMEQEQRRKKQCEETAQQNGNSNNFVKLIISK